MFTFRRLMVAGLFVATSSLTFAQDSTAKAGVAPTAEQAPPVPLDPEPTPEATPAPESKPGLAVVDFAVFGTGVEVSDGKAIAELLLHLLADDRFRLVERHRLDAVMTELNFQSSDLVESAERAASVGKQVGVKKLLTGSLLRFGSSLRVTARLVEVETGLIEGRGLLVASSMDEVGARLGELCDSLGLRNEAPPQVAIAPTATPNPFGAPILEPTPAASVQLDHPTPGAPEVLFSLDERAPLRMLLLRPGTFMMGSSVTENGRQLDEGPQTEVSLTFPFYLGTTEVTVDQFAAFVAATGHTTLAEREGWSYGAYTRPGDTEWRKMPGLTWKTPGFKQDGDHPVVNVSWYDADLFCQWMSQTTGWRFGLPSEAMWEYACRAGSRTRYSWGDMEEEGFGFANGADASASWAFPGWVTFSWQDGWVHTSPVGIFEPNAFGLSDMHGNVWEWCGDWYLPRLAGGRVADPRGPTTGTRKVYRGGSWDHMPPRLRSAHREKDAPTDRFFNLGFRVAALPPE